MQRGNENHHGCYRVDCCYSCALRPSHCSLWMQTQIEPYRVEECAFRFIQLPSSPVFQGRLIECLRSQLDHCGKPGLCLSGQTSTRSPLCLTVGALRAVDSKWSSTCLIYNCSLGERSGLAPPRRATKQAELHAVAHLSP